MKKIEINGKFNEFQFVEKFMDFNLNILKEDEDIFVDFTDCCYIEHDVIADLLVFGEILKTKRQNRMILYIPPNGRYAQRIRNYLYDINFLALAEKNNHIDISWVKDYLETGNLKDRLMPEYCITTEYDVRGKYSDKIIGLEDKAEFVAKLMEEEITNKYWELFHIHLNQFLYLKVTTGEDGRQKFEKYNMLQYFITQLARNSIVHGLSKVYISMQGIRKENICSITISDNGQGMTQKLKKKIEAYLDAPKTEKNPLSIVQVDTYMKYDKYNQDIFACIEGLAYRFDDEIFGLYNVLKNVFEQNGEFHIHSNTALIILRADCNDYISDASCRTDFSMGLFNYLKETDIEQPNSELTRVNKTSEFIGTQIKIKIPIK